MYSDPNKSIFLNFDKFKEIIDSKNDYYELQLEGGEPFLHQHFYLFLEYAYYTKKCSKIIISTNGIILNDHLQKLINFHSSSNIPIVIKRSINYHLYNLDNNIFRKCRDLYIATEFIEGFDIKFNVRIEKDDTFIIEKLKEFKIFEQSNIYNFQKYGRLSDDKKYSEPFICQNIDDWFIYACDGTCFGKDLISRSKYEKILK
jgi:molybdenum cofactor biosynthesis enzyme MoaA